MVLFNLKPPCFTHKRPQYWNKMNKMNKNDRKKKTGCHFKSWNPKVSTHSPRVEPLWLVHLSRQFLAVQSSSAKSGNSKTAKAQNMSVSWIGEKHDMYIYYIYIYIYNYLYILIFKTTHQTTYQAIPELTETRIPAQSQKILSELRPDPPKEKTDGFKVSLFCGGFHSHGGAPNHAF